MIRPATRKEVSALIQAHYLHRWPGVVVAILALQREEQITGVVVFALPPRETAKRYRVTCCWELARLYLIDEEPKNTESWFISQAIRWVKKNRPEVEALVSYADPSANHSGIIYRAANWIQDGRTDQERKTPRFDYCHDGKHYSRRSHVPLGVIPSRIPRISKYRFVYWMSDHEKKRSFVER